MVLAELAGLVVGVVIAIATYRVSRIREAEPLGYAASSEWGLQRDGGMPEAQVKFQFDKIFTLKLSSKGYAKAVGIGLVVVLFAAAFVMVCVGLRYLGFTA